MMTVGNMIAETDLLGPASLIEMTQKLTGIRKTSKDNFEAVLDAAAVAQKEGIGKTKEVVAKATGFLEIRPSDNLIDYPERTS
jgi:hypothetical protein